MRSLLLIAHVAIVSATAPMGFAADVDYLRDIKPLLAAKCAACHGALKQESNLRLDVGALIHLGGEGGAVIAAGNADGSSLIARVSSLDLGERMPPDGEGEALTPAQIELLRAWINAGAPHPADEKIPPNPREHWAYQPPVRSEIPAVKNAAWQTNPIDAFLAAKQEAAGIEPAAPASAHVLLRRLHLDLIGLPPTPQEIADFELRIAALKKEQPSASGDPHSALRIPHSALAAVVDNLLARPEYGERWGRHWMDVWRYSDWSGFGNEIRSSQRHIWRWRDWIVESLNADKPYDQMVREMLAGDELAPADPQALRATGYLARSWYKFNRNMWLDDTVEHTAKAFLGMTLNCAKCHDHKYDPLAQRQYYELRAIFEPHDIRTDAQPGQPDVMQDGLPRAFDKDLTVLTYLFERGNEKTPVKDQAIAPATPQVLGVEFKVEPVTLAVEAYYPALRPEQIDARLATLRSEVQKWQAELQKRAAENAAPVAVKEAELQLHAAKQALMALDARVAADRAKYFGPAEKLPELAPLAAKAEKELVVAQAQLAHHQVEQTLAAAKQKASEKPDDKPLAEAAANAEKQLPEAAKKLADAQAALAQPGDKYTPLGEEFPRTSSGRRLALARAITHRRNPLAARVAVNHIWLRHFGTPLVENVFDFGLRSPRPQHAELLDWLAVEFMEHGWSTKHLHRLIVLSQAYELSSSRNHSLAANLQADADNRLYWRMNARRLEAEAVRDSVLFVAGSLDATRGGPDIDHEQGQTSRRRSIYLRHAYEKKMKFLELFDAASETDCYRRSESIIPQQALALSNSQLAVEQSRVLAGKLIAAVKQADAAQEQIDREFIRQAFITVLSRSPRDEEVAACLEFLRQQSTLLADAGKLTATGGPNVNVAPSSDASQRAREGLIHVLLNHNDFVTIR